MPRKQEVLYNVFVMNVEFEEDNFGIRQNTPPKMATGMAGYLQKKGLVKTTFGANIALILLAILFFALAIVIPTILL